MRTTILAATLLAATALHAQGGLTLLPVISDPDMGDDYIVPQCISPNAEWVGGTMLYGMEAVTYNVATATPTVYPLSDEDAGAQVNGVANDGTGAGWDGPATLFHTDGTTTAIGTGTGFRHINADATLAVGYVPNAATGQTVAAYWNGGAEMHALPCPTSAEAGFEVNGSAAMYVSADAAVIAGYVIDNFSTFPVIVWTKADTGYVADFIGRDYFRAADAEESTAPYTMFTVGGMSANGRWLGLSLATAEGTGGYGRYDLTTRTLEVFVADGTNEDIASVEGPNVVSVANDGTIVSYTGYGTGKGLIWEPGQSAPQLLSKRFPGVSAFSRLDTDGMHLPSGISADARYIMGYGTVLDAVRTYIFDTQAYAATAIAAPQAAAPASADRLYNAAGQTIAAPAAQGLTITRHADGTATKALRR